MKLTRNLCLILIIAIACFGCNTLDLKRDNPLDSQNPNFVPKKDIKFQSYQVVCKYISGATDFSTENTVKAGDRIFLRINVANTGQATLSKLRAEITSISNLIQIAPITNDFVKLTQESELDYIDVGQSGWSVITDGSSFQFAPNGDDYGIEFTVSNSAQTGGTISFHLKSKDNTGQVWEEDFGVAIN